MMLRERSYEGRTVHVPPWSSAADDTASSYDDYSLFLKTSQRYLPSNCNDVVAESKFADVDNVEFLPVDAHSCDHFRMFEFKVRKCTRGRSHDWTECPFAHSGEKASRRDPRKYHYSSTSCPDFRKGSCRKGEACEFSHGVFECWLHPARYRTQPCKDGMSCKRRVCFFAHSPDQLRHPSPAAQSYDGSPRTFISSPDPVSPSTESPPMSPMMANSVSASFRQMHLNQVKLASSSWLGSSQSPRLKVSPTTPTGFSYFEAWERVVSDRDLRVKRIEKLSKEIPLDQVMDPNPDVDWVSDLIN